MARKGFYEELNIKKYIAELTPLMCKYVLEVMQGADDRAKENLTAKILPKIIDKGLPTMITGEEGGAIVIKIAKEIAENYETPQHAEPGSEG
jgi:hypothetical protein